MKKLLITGSRDTIPAMVKYVYDYLQQYRPDFVIVGDAKGVDTAVCYACIKYQIPVMSFGKDDKPRTGINIKRVPYVKCANTFWKRDAYMVDLCDYVLGVWNGYSSGTKYTIDLALFQQKPVDLIDFSKVES